MLRAGLGPSANIAPSALLLHCCFAPVCPHEALTTPDNTLEVPRTALSLSLLRLFTLALALLLHLYTLTAREALVLVIFFSFGEKMW